MIIFGPVPSRRLGYSLGVNNIPPKICTFSCIYCQIGRTKKMQLDREEFYCPERIFQYTARKVKDVQKKNEKIDYITFVADGEPTLDANLGKEIDLIKKLGIKVAVISNSSLIWQDDVKKDLEKADLVSLKIDSLDEKLWRKIERPHRRLELSTILAGIEEFSSRYSGKLITETMLVKGFNDHRSNIEEIADFLSKIKPAIAYLSVPTRPPAEKGVEMPDESAINLAYQVLKEKLDLVECLTGYEGNEFFASGNVEEDVLSITSVHPMREDALKTFLEKTSANWETVEEMIQKNLLVELEFGSHKFYLRKLQKSR